MECKIREIPVLLSTCFHAAVLCRNKVYIHGGMLRYPSNEMPVKDVMVFEPTTGTLIEVKTKNPGPPRSHHAAIAVNEHSICVVGGWDGKKRSTDVWMFDVDTNEWKMLESDPSCNLPAGLSSHTCLLIKPNEAVVTGREGGVRMQRRFGSSFKLGIDVSSNRYAYEELPYHIASRAGHTCCAVSKKLESSTASLLVLGGRDSNDVDHLPIQSPTSNADLGKQLYKIIKSGKMKTISQRSIRNHAALSAGHLALVHGGEVFGKVRDNVVGDLRVHDASATRWWEVVREEPAMKRMGHSMFWINNRIYIIGGVTRGEACRTVIEIDLPS